MKRKLYDDKNDAVTLTFSLRSYSYLFVFKYFLCSTGYTHLNAIIHLVETVLKRSYILKAA